MKQIARRSIFVISLTFWIFAGIMDFQSRFRSQEWTYQRLEVYAESTLVLREFSIISANGRVLILHYYYKPHPYKNALKDTQEAFNIQPGWKYKCEVSGMRLRNLGWIRLINTRGRSERFIGVIMPWWSLWVFLSISPGWGLMKLWKRFLRTSRGYCSVCGYDLRATPNRCPECGTVLQKKRKGRGLAAGDYDPSK
jgi:hypothetical protein